MLRCPVPSATTHFVSALGPPSNQPIPRPNAIKRSPARIARVPNTCKTLSMFAAVIKHINRTRLTLEIQSSVGFTRAAQARPAPGLLEMIKLIVQVFQEALRFAL